MTRARAFAGAWFVRTSATHERWLRIAIGGLTVLCALASIVILRAALQRAT